MARIDEEPEDRDQTPLRLEQFVECAMCGQLQDVQFPTPPGVYELEDLTESPEIVWTCVSCGFEAEITFSKWTIHDEA